MLNATGIETGSERILTTDLPQASSSVHQQKPKQSILFIHGWWGGAWVWDQFQTSFATLGYDCHTIELYDKHQQTGESFYKHLERILQAVERLGNPIVIGHSAGGLLVQKLLEQIDLPAGILIASAAPRGILSIRTWLLAKTIVRYAAPVMFQKTFLLSRTDMYALNLNGLTTEEKEAVYDRMVPISAKEVVEVAVKGVPVDATRVRTPLLVVNGSQDRLTPVSIAQRIARKYNASYREYAGNAHYIIRETNWKDVANDISKWLVH